MSGLPPHLSSDARAGGGGGPGRDAPRGSRPPTPVPDRPTQRLIPGGLETPLSLARIFAERPYRDRAGDAAGPGGMWSDDSFPPRETTTQRLRVGTAHRVTG